MFRLIGIIITLAIVGLMFVKMQRSGNEAVNSNPAVKEQRQVLQQATGVDASDPKALKDYALKQAEDMKRIQEEQQKTIDQMQ